ncbi:MAG: DJ-1/PfpI family protein [Gemmataceae bacterium]
MKKVLLVIGDAAEVFDTMYPLHRIREDGFQVVVAAPEKRLYHLVMHDTHPDWDITVESPGYKLASDIAFRDIRPEEYVGLVLSGGRAPEYLRYDEDLLRVTRYFFDQQLPVASVCHGIEILATAGVIRGLNVTTVPKCRFDAEVCGAKFLNQEVVVSGHLVTARTWHDNHAWMREFMKLLNGVTK